MDKYKYIYSANTNTNTYIAQIEIYIGCKYKYNNQKQICYGVVVVVRNYLDFVKYKIKSYLKSYKLYKLYKSNPIQICFVLLLLCNKFVLGCCICTCTLYVFVFVLYMYLYLYLHYICICICPGGPKGPHLVAEGHQPSAGARSLAPLGGQIF